MSTQNRVSLTGRSFHIITLGCKVNQFESDAMRRLLEEAGAVWSGLEQAEICIINTCSVTNIADRKSRQMMHHARKLRPNAVIAACGCYVQAAGESLLRDGSVDLLIGNDRKSQVSEILYEYLNPFPEITDDKTTVLYDGKSGVPNLSQDPRKRLFMTDISAPCKFEQLPAALPGSMTRAYLKIQDGCNAFCTYCIIPYVRGRIRNKPLADILRETGVLASGGVREVVLTGIHLSAFDDAEKANGSTLTLTDVIRQIAAVPGIERIRLGSLEPRVITPEFLQVITSIPKVCPHFHLSLQSADDRTLKRMNRHYTIEEFMDITRLLREAYDRPALTTDVIVGFPGETEEEFENTCANLEKLDFYEMHVFKYSRRRGTLADKMPDQLTEAVKNERSRRLLAMTASHKAKYEASFKGEQQNVLVEEVLRTDKGIFLRGHTERYILVDIPFECLSSSCSISNQPAPEEFINRIISFKN